MWDLALIFAPVNVITCLVGAIVGIIFAIIPGISTALPIALFLPFTFSMGPVQAFAFLLALYVAGATAGAFTAILINTPGTAAAVATVLDGYPLGQQGRVTEALSLATYASCAGGTLGGLCLIALAPRLASIALLFGPAEFFAIGLFGLGIVSSLSSDNFLKGIIAASLGVLVSTVGMDPIAGSIRMTFGNRSLIAGIEFISVIIGFFAISEVLIKLEGCLKLKPIPKFEISGKMGGLQTLWKNKFNIIRSSIIGVIVGIIPATGTSTAVWVAYNEAKRVSKNKELFGKGSTEGLIACESADSACCGGTLIPMITLGVPGDHITAIMLGAFLIQGLTPGPALFRDHPEVVTGIYAMFIMSVIFVAAFARAGVRVFAKVLDVPINILMPCVLVVCMIGTYTYASSMLDIRIALISGIIGYLFKKANFPFAPVLLGLILGELVEFNFRRSLAISGGSFSIFLRPISATFISVAFIVFIGPILAKQYRKYKYRNVQSEA